MRSKFPLSAAGVLLATAPILGHHAFGGEFDPNKPVLLKGPVTKVEWVNPHAWIHLEVTKPDGTGRVDGRRRRRTLFCRGVTRESLKVGTVPAMRRYQARDHRFRARPQRDPFDGCKLFLGQYRSADRRRTD